MKRRVSAMAAVMLAVLLITGYASPSATTTHAAPAHKSGPFTIGYDIYFLGNSWSVQLAAEFKWAVQQHKKDIKNVVYTSSDGDAAKQVANIQSLIAKHVDAIIITPASPTSSAHVIAQAKAAGIPVILLAATANTNAYTSLVTVKDTDFGRVLAQWLAKKLHGKGNIYVLNGIAGLSVNADRFNAAQAVFKNYPGIHIIAQANADWDQAKGKTATATMLAAHPNVDGVWSQGGAMTLGAIQAFQAAKHQLVPMTGESYNGFLKEWLKLRQQHNMHFDAIASSKPTWLADKALQETLAILKGQKYDRTFVPAPPVITAANINKFVKPNLPDSVWVDTHMPNSALKKLFSH